LKSGLSIFYNYTMLVYSLAFFYIFLCTYIYDIKGAKKYAQLHYTLICVWLILIAGLRYRVGGDTLSYFDDYNSFPTFPEFPHTDFSELKYEPLFYAITAFSKLLHPDFAIFQFIQAGIVNITFFYFISQRTSRKFASVCLYFMLMYFYFNMEIMRESMSVCVFLLSIRYIEKQNYWAYYLFIMIAYSIHTSAIFLFPFPLMYLILQKGTKYLFFVFAFITYLFIYIMNTPVILLYLPLKVALKLYNYISSGPMDPKGAILNYIHIIALWLILIVGKRNRCLNPQFAPFLKMNILIYSLTPFITGIYRITNYFAIFEILALVNTCIEPLKSWKIKQISCLQILCSGMLLLMLKVQHDTINTSEYAPHTRFYNLYIPYESILTKKQHPNRENIYYIQMREMHLKREKK